jgi:hypothetical protein
MDQTRPSIMAAQEVRPMLSIIDDGLRTTNLAKAIPLIENLEREIKSMNAILQRGEVVKAPKKDMEELASQISEHIAKDVQALTPACIAADNLRKTIDEMRAETNRQKERHEVVQRLATGQVGF